MTKTVDVHITKFTGEKIVEPYGEHNRCDNCGRPVNESESIITGGELCEVEWACGEECYVEMVKKGCAFEELGDMTYRQQKH